jgi:hypothetical protein
MNRADHTDSAYLTPDQIAIIQHPPLRSGMEDDWPASPRLATLELHPDDAESSYNVGPVLGDHANSLSQGLTLQLYSDRSLLLHPQVPQPTQGQTGWEMNIYQPQEAPQSDSSALVHSN